MHILWEEYCKHTFGYFYITHLFLVEQARITSYNVCYTKLLRLVNFICANSEINVKAKQLLLEESELYARSVKLLELLSTELQMLELKNDIQKKVKAELDNQQKEYLLNQQIKTIQNELGGNPVEKDIEELKEKAKSKKWNEEVAKMFEKETDSYNFV